MRSQNAIASDGSKSGAAIVAGSKVSTKLTILKSLAQRVDQLIVGGGIANTFMLAAGLPIGKSLAEPDLANEAKEIMAMMEGRGAKVPIPEDVVCGRAFSADTPAHVLPAASVAADDMILDIGPKTAHAYASLLGKAGTVGLLVVVVAIVAALYPALLDMDARSYGVIAAVSVAALVIGHLLGPRDSAEKTVLAVECAVRHPGLAVTIAATNFTPERALPVLVPCILTFIAIATVYLIWRGRSA